MAPRSSQHMIRLLYGCKWYNTRNGQSNTSWMTLSGECVWSDQSITDLFAYPATSMRSSSGIDMHRTAVCFVYVLSLTLLDFDLNDNDERMSCRHWRVSVEGSRNNEEDDEDVFIVHLPIYTNDVLYKSIAPFSLPTARWTRLL